MQRRGHIPFRQNFSCETALSDFTDDVESALLRGQYAIGCFIDVQGAFDTVDHKFILHKLQCYGLSESLISWFNSYLSQRKNSVNILGHTSNEFFPTSRVPQGSLLGQFLFIVFFDEITEIGDITVL